MSETTSATTSRTKCRTLIVEDERSSRELLRSLLKMLGHEVWVAPTAQAAITTILQERPDCIVLDLMLPDRSGVEVLRVIREHRLAARVAIYSATVDPDQFPGLAELKPDAVFEKGRDLKKLREWLEQQG